MIWRPSIWMEPGDECFLMGDVVREEVHIATTPVPIGVAVGNPLVVVVHGHAQHGGRR
jgi:hypothetical protein